MISQTFSNKTLHSINLYLKTKLLQRYKNSSINLWQHIKVVTKLLSNSDKSPSLPLFLKNLWTKLKTSDQFLKHCKFNSKAKLIVMHWETSLKSFLSLLMIRSQSCEYISILGKKDLGKPVSKDHVKSHLIYPHLKTTNTLWMKSWIPKSLR